jgi:MFS family permease
MNLPSSTRVSMRLFLAMVGLSLGAPLALLPTLLAESVGLKCYGTLSGGMLSGASFGALIGPVTAGAIYDWTGSYSPAWVICIAIMLVGALAPLACEPFKDRAQAMANLQALDPARASVSQGLDPG